MEKYYQILGLSQGASQEEIVAAYNKLRAELQPKNVGNEEFFAEELAKLEEAYEALRNSTILSSEDPIISKPEPIGNKSNDTHAPKPTQSVNPSKLNYEKTFLVVLGLAVIGIWGIFLQNMGIIGPLDSHNQKVVVVNQVDTYSKGGEVEVTGSVNANIYDQVDINITSIRGYRPWINVENDNAVLGIYSEDANLQR